MRIVALMTVTMVLAALAVDGLFSLAGLLPRIRPTRSDIFGSVHVDYKLVTNVLGAIIFVSCSGSRCVVEPPIPSAG